ncbi:ATP-grasp domain-containing protein [Ancylobacter lacus]|uniref:ATP-grasp domain-containing protein n=1 Tax=Ancylobacter lacus TaxID=2579970 RepID=UPI001FEA95DC|nr:ATP-grasp domain-containing protein [Ancylobacter lacus]
MAQLTARAAPGLPVVLGSGFEEAPDLVARIARDFDVVGNGPDQLYRLKDPVALTTLLASLAIPHPRLFPDGAPAGTAALEKRIGGSGGWHVTPAERARGPGWYLQERLPGDPVSALFLGDGTRARLLGFSRQWASPTAGAPFRYGGAAGPIAVPEVITREVTQALDALVAAAGTVGLMSADLLLTAQGWNLIEINPRPGATLDIFDHAPLPPLLRLHLDACGGRLPDIAPLMPRPGRPAHAAAVLYAPQAIGIGHDPLPAWTVDRPAPGTRIEANDPLCTVRASADTAEAARTAVTEQMDELWRALRRSRRTAAAQET